MAENSLILKYRPAALDQVIGQEAIAASLAGVIKKGASHSFLFIGPSGCGKTTLARIVAAQLGCRDQDIREIDAASNSGIEDMRSITAGLQYRPMGEQIRKAIIVDECHALSKQAWQATLKSLEEPPEWMLWFFCTTERGKVPATVITRCAKYELRPVATDKLVDLLDYIAGEEKYFPKVKEDAEIIALCARSAMGSPRQAIANLVVCAEAKTKAEAAELLKAADGSMEAFELARALLRGAKWMEVCALLQSMKEQDAESIRHVVRAYMTTVVLGAKSEKTAGAAMEILDAFGQPFPTGDGVTPVVLACGRLLLGARV